LKPSKEKSKTVVLILAAGGSKRMGKKIKQLLAWKNTTLLQHSIKQATNSAAEEVYVVLGAYAAQIKSVLNTDINIIYNEAWEAGIGSSIAKGVTHICEKQSRHTNVLIMLADQPFVTTTELNRLIDNFYTKEYSIVASKYGKGIGVPAIFANTYLKELKQLQNDEGAKKILSTHKSSCLSVEISTQLDDIDNPEDYERLKNN
jgi:molybdenum cofactor cytidylyltransferase